jgi:CRISPR-associated endonuclease/helicase Cas3
LPPVAPWLHGKEDGDAPRTELAWRSDVKWLAERSISSEQIAEMLEYYPVLVREKISEPSTRVVEKLKKIHAQMKADDKNPQLIVIDSDGAPEVHDLAYVIERLAVDEAWLDYKMLILPDAIGSISEGMFSTAPPPEGAPTEDVADRVSEGNYQRIRFVFENGAPQRLPTKEQSASDPGAPQSLSRLDLAAFTAQGYKPELVIRRPDYDNEAIVYFGAHSGRRAGKPVNVPLHDHQQRVAERARRLACDAGLDQLAEIFEQAGCAHDNGKDREIWQLAMGGSPEHPLAKTKQPVNPRLIGGYRHELGSLLDLLDENGERDDLLLHLIASHHKAARPYFEPRHYDRKNLTGSAKQSVESARRYARLQEKYGAWGLAYLEALFKAADGQVSKAEGDPASA